MTEPSSPSPDAEQPAEGEPNPAPPQPGPFQPAEPATPPSGESSFTPPAMATPPGETPSAPAAETPSAPPPVPPAAPAVPASPYAPQPAAPYAPPPAAQSPYAPPPAPVPYTPPAPQGPYAPQSPYAPPPAAAAPYTPPAPAGYGWGAPTPVWESPAATPTSRRPMFLVGAATLAVGLAVGAVGTVVFAREAVNGGSRTATLLVDDTPVKSNGPGTAVSVAQQLGPAVGTIIARDGSSGSALGSGFVIAHDGQVSYMLTNNHVVAGATDLHVVMPGGRNLKATIVGTDAFDDLGVISVPDGSLPVATFGNSKILTVGEAVVAIGSPLGNEGSVTEGVISALHRTITAGGDTGGQTETLQDVLQTDASINRGNSGGPLADTEGRVVGVNVAIAGDASNIGFSIPADVAKNVARELIAHEKVQHPFLGIEYFTSIEAVEEGQGFDGPGVLVRTVRAGSPAEKAGFQKGDILQAVDGTSIDNGQTLGGLIQQHQVGDRIDFTVKRNGSTVHLSAVLVDRPSSA